MVVWERHDSLYENSGYATVEACYIDTLPTRTHMSDTTRLRLSAQKVLTAEWMRLAPSIVGMKDGYVASW